MPRTENNFIEGPILSPLLRFTLPVLLALFLQTMYGAVDLMVVGQFGQSADVSAVSTGYFHGGFLAGLFARDAEVIGAGADYLRAYAIDTILTSIMFCFAGYFNGRGSTAFVMAQGIVGAFLVRIPVSLLMSRQVPVSLFRVGLATPCSTAVQILIFLVGYAVLSRRERQTLAQ